MYRIILIFILLWPLIGEARNYTISGTIYDQSTRETLLSAYVTETSSWQKTATNQSGFYSLTLPEGTVNLRISYIGYEEVTKQLTLTCDTLIDFFLPKKETIIGEVVVTAEVPVHEQTLMGKTMIPIEKIMKVPTFVGIPDLMKAITIIPGISLGSEARSDIFVRGGDRGQNLILLDGAKLYNTNHLGGFVSLFNTDIIKQVDVYKSGFPSRYGGRASSVIDITTRDGNREKMTKSFSIGLLSSSATIDGPIGERLSFIAGLRTTYYDLFTLKSRIDYSRNENGDYFGYTFYDVNAKLTYHISDKHKAFINIFSGKDLNKSKYKQFYTTGFEKSNSAYNIHNTCITLTDRLTLNAKTLWMNSLIFSRYKNSLEDNMSTLYEGKSREDLYKSFTTISEKNFQSRIEYYASKNHSLKAGVEASRYYFTPGNSRTKSKETESGYLLDTIVGFSTPFSANEAALYAEDDICFGNNFYANIGLRGVVFTNEGTSYLKAEPRISLRAKFNDYVSLKASYTSMNQFNHVIIINYSFYEKETWITSTKNIPPQEAQQFSMGVFTSAPSLKTEFSVEAYYKKMNNLTEYNPATSADFILPNLDKTIVKGGKGEAYGIEFQAKYATERLTLDAGYVLSWNYRQFEEINNGLRYPFVYDRRHQLSILGSLILGKQYFLNANFSYATGRPFTIPESYVSIYTGSSDRDNYMYHAFSEKNNYRMPDYHRLDVALVKQKISKKGHMQQFSFNVYNIYARQNPISIFFREGKFYQVSLFTIVPTISYSIKF